MAESSWRAPNEWSEWSDWLAAGLHAGNRWRLPVLLTGILFAHGRRTVTSWLRAAGVAGGYSKYCYFLTGVGRKANLVARQVLLLLLRVLPLPNRLLAVIDDSPTKRYGPKVEGAAIDRNPTPGPADQKYLYGDIWRNVAVYHLNLWMHTLVELWAWKLSLPVRIFAGGGPQGPSLPRQLTSRDRRNMREPVQPLPLSRRVCRLLAPSLLSSLDVLSFLKARSRDEADANY